MAESNVYRVIVVNFISSLIIAIVISDILYQFGLKGGLFLGNLFGLYFLVVYGMNNLVEARKISNNYKRFIFVILYIIVFDIVYMVLMPLIFGPNVFPASEYMSINYNGMLFDCILSKEFYLALFAVIVLLFNFIIYKRTKNN